MFAFRSLAQAASNIIGEIEQVELDDNGDPVIPNNDSIKRFSEMDDVSLLDSSDHFSSLTKSLRRLRELGATPQKVHDINNLVVAANLIDSLSSEELHCADANARLLYEDLKSSLQTIVKTDSNIRHILNLGLENCPGAELIQADYQVEQALRSSIKNRAENLVADIEEAKREATLEMQEFQDSAARDKEIKQVELLDLVTLKSQVDAQQLELSRRNSQILRMEEDLSQTQLQIDTQSREIERILRDREQVLQEKYDKKMEELKEREIEMMSRGCDESRSNTNRSTEIVVLEQKYSKKLEALNKREAELMNRILDSEQALEEKYSKKFEEMNKREAELIKEPSETTIDLKKQTSDPPKNDVAHSHMAQATLNSLKQYLISNDDSKREAFLDQLSVPNTKEEKLLLKLQSVLISSLEQQIAMKNAVVICEPPSDVTVLGELQRKFNASSASDLVKDNCAKMRVENMQIGGEDGVNNYYEKIIVSFREGPSTQFSAESTARVMGLVQHCADILSKNASKLVALQEAYCRLGKFTISNVMHKSELPSEEFGCQVNIILQKENVSQVETQTIEKTTEELPKSNLIDKRFAASVVAKCIERNCRRDCLEIVASTLEFDAEEMKRVGLHRDESFWGSVFIPNWAKGVAKVDHIPNIDQHSFGDLLDDFVRDETT